MDLFVGFFVGTASLMLLTALLKPVLMRMETFGPFIGFLTPFLVGLIGGARTAFHGHRHQLSLRAALLSGFFIRRT